MQTLLPLGFGHLDWGKWFHGMFASMFTMAGVLGSGALGLFLNGNHKVIVENPEIFFKTGLIMAAAGGFAGFLAFIAKEGLPDKIVETTVELTETDSAKVPDVKVTTVKTTEAAPVVTTETVPPAPKWDGGAH